MKFEPENFIWILVIIGIVGWLLGFYTFTTLAAVGMLLFLIAATREAIELYNSLDDKGRWGVSKVGFHIFFITMTGMYLMLYFFGSCNF